MLSPCELVNQVIDELDPDDVLVPALSKDVWERCDGEPALVAVVSLTNVLTSILDAFNAQPRARLALVMAVIQVLLESSKPEETIQ